MACTRRGPVSELPRPPLVRRPLLREGGEGRSYKGGLGGAWRALPHLDAHDLDNAFESATPAATIDHQLTGTTDDLSEATTQDRTSTAAINEHLWQILAHDTGHHLAIAWMRADEMASGYREGTFRPGQLISRGAAARLLYEMADPDFTRGELATLIFQYNNEVAQ